MERPALLLHPGFSAAQDETNCFKEMQTSQSVFLPVPEWQLVEPDLSPVLRRWCARLPQYTLTSSLAPSSSFSSFSSSSSDEFFHQLASTGVSSPPFSGVSILSSNVKSHKAEMYPNVSACVNNENPLRCLKGHPSYLTGTICEWGWKSLSVLTGKEDEDGEKEKEKKEGGRCIGGRAEYGD